MATSRKTPICPHCEADLSNVGTFPFNWTIGAAQGVLLICNNCSKVLGVVNKPPSS
jgi:hypothetical protein